MANTIGGPAKGARGGASLAGLGSQVETGAQVASSPAPGVLADAGKLEAIVSGILRGGVLACAAIVAAGVLLWAGSGHSGYPPGGYPAGLRAVLRGVWEVRPLAIVQLGLWVLVLTPVMRVVASLVMFASQRDWAYVGFAVAVLVLLAAGLWVGAA